MFLKYNIANNNVHAEQDVAAKKSFPQRGPFGRRMPINNIGICSGPKDSFGDEQIGDIAPKHDRKTQTYLIEVALVYGVMVPHCFCDTGDDILPLALSCRRIGDEDNNGYMRTVRQCNDTGIIRCRGDAAFVRP